MTNADESKSIFLTPEGTILCDGCTPLGRCRLGIVRNVMTDEQTMVTDLMCPREQSSGASRAHGGWAASVFVELLGVLPQHLGFRVVTAQMSVDFVKPIFVDVPMIAYSKVDRIDGRKVFESSEIRVKETEEVMARATGLWIKLPVTAS